MLIHTRRQFLQSIGWGTVALAVTPLHIPERLLEKSASRLALAPAAQSLIDLCATIDGLAVTFYYQAIKRSGGFFGSLPTRYQRYLRVTLAAEWSHYRLWLDQYGATSAQSSFYFQTQGFAAGHFADFLAEMERLERAQSALLLAAIRQMGELGDFRLAEVLGQVAAIESEQRAIGREMAQNSPPAPNDRCFEQADFALATDVTTALAELLQGGVGYSGPLPLPAASDVTAAIGSAICESVDEAGETNCSESISQILDIAANAEGLGITFYYHAIQGPLFTQLSEAQQWYLQAALDEERQHLDFLLANGATTPADAYFFAPHSFDDLSTFLTLLDTLENSFIAAYLAAMQRFAQLGQPLLAEIAAQIAGIESEHRLLGRVLAGEKYPNNRCLAKAAYGCVSDALDDLAPFLSGNATLSDKRTRPTAEMIAAAVASFGCTPVALAQAVQFQYLPLVAR